MFDLFRHWNVWSPNRQSTWLLSHCHGIWRSLFAISWMRSGWNTIDCDMRFLICKHLDAIHWQVINYRNTDWTEQCAQARFDCIYDVRHLTFTSFFNEIMSFKFTCTCFRFWCTMPLSRRLAATRRGTKRAPMPSSSRTVITSPLLATSRDPSASAAFCVWPRFASIALSGVMLWVVLNPHQIECCAECGFYFARDPQAGAVIPPTTTWWLIPAALIWPKSRSSFNKAKFAPSSIRTSSATRFELIHWIQEFSSTGDFIFWNNLFDIRLQWIRVQHRQCGSGVWAHGQQASERKNRDCD